VILFTPLPAPAPRILALAPHEPISSGNQEFKIQNPRVSASRERGSLIPSPLNPLTPRRPAAAFTLVELLAVIGIMGLLAAVGVPALKGLTGSGGRKQALSQVMGALEIARNTAISTGTNAAVIFPDQSFTNQAYRYRSMAVISWDATNSATGTNVMLGSWIVLPQGVVLHDVQINQLPTLRNTTALRIPPRTSPTNISNLRAIVFQSDGGLEESYYTNTLTSEGIAFYEGAVVANFTTTTNTSKQTNNAETITLTHYTGRTIPTLAKPK
jgi:type II secretory pathway pseudopilin PulG